MITPEISKPLRQLVNSLENLGDLLRYVDSLKSMTNDAPELEARIATLHADLANAQDATSKEQTKVAELKNSIEDLKSRHAVTMKETEQEFIAQREALAEVKSMHAEAITLAGKELSREKAQIVALMKIERERLADLMKEEEAVANRIAKMKQSVLEQFKGI